MDIKVSPSFIEGEITVPGSKSHTIRALLIASFANGTSTIKNALLSADTLSCIEVCKAFGAKIETNGNTLTVVGNAGIIPPVSKPIDVGNSGTTLFLALALATLSDKPITFVGDKQIDKRSAKPLLDALQTLGASVSSNFGCTPITICGPLKSGKISIECPTSQYLSALLLALPLSKNNVEISLPLLNEKPYVEMTLSWLAKQNVKIKNSKFKTVKISSNSLKEKFYSPINCSIPADYSSASFFIVAGALASNHLVLKGLDPKDSQGDKKIIPIMKKMGAKIRWQKEASAYNLIVKAPTSCVLKPISVDLNTMPDSLPILSVASAFAFGESCLYNVAHARLKETDRITVMAQELLKVAIPATQRPDGLTIEGMPENEMAISNYLFEEQNKDLCVEVDGHDDHRVIMSLAIAAKAGVYSLVIKNADAVSVTYPEFFQTLESISIK